jgi:hypothetical protein
VSAQKPAFFSSAFTDVEQVNESLEPEFKLAAVEGATLEAELKEDEDDEIPTADIQPNLHNLKFNIYLKTKIKDLMLGKIILGNSCLLTFCAKQTRAYLYSNSFCFKEST